MPHILIVDDSSAVRMAVRGILQSIGATTDEAEDGEACLQKVELNRYDAVLLDWNLPGVNGLECLKKLRQDPLHETLPVLMVTTVDDFAQIALALQSGANEYIIKPFDKEIIQRKLADAGVGVIKT